MGLLHRTADRVRAVPEGTWSKGAAQTHLENLERYWKDFQENHAGLLRFAEQQRELPYFKEHQYDTAETSYIECKTQLLDIQQALNALAQAAPIVTRVDQRARHELPRLSVPIFSGRRESWESFRDLFIAIVHDHKEISDVVRMQYLRDYVRGDALVAIEGLPITAANYSIAWKTLVDRYEHRRLLITDHIQALRNLKPLKDESASSLQRRLDTVRLHRDQLTALGRPVEHWDDWFVHCTLSSLDANTCRSWQEEIEALERDNADADPSTFTNLLAFLGRRVRTLESVETTRRSTTSSSQPLRLERPSRALTAATSADYSRCSLCTGPHYLGHCPEFRGMRTAERKELVSRKGLCYNCLRADHSRRSCPSRSTCQLCREDHHTTLHVSSSRRSDAMDCPIPAKRGRQAGATTTPKIDRPPSPANVQ